MADTSMHFFPRWGDRRYLQVEICIWVNFVLLFFEHSAIGYCCWCPMVRIKKFFILYFRFTRKKEMDDFVWNYWKLALWTGVLVIMNMDSSCHEFRFFLAFDFCRFCVVIRFVHLRRLWRISIPDLIHYIIFLS